MKQTTKLTKTSVIIIICSLLFFSFKSTSALSTSFSDDFNRPDGIVGNEWTSWWADNINHPKSMLVNGELRSYGYNTLGGGIYRTFPVSFPVQFSFDFRTENIIIDPECGTGTYNDGGWRITINAADYANPMESVAQVKFEQWAGSRVTVRRYLTNPGAANQAGMAEDVALPVYGQRNFTENSSHVEGIIFEDLSASFTIHYNDGQSPDPVIINFGAAPGAINHQPGELLMLSNSNCSSGPNYFDNFRINPPNQPPVADAGEPYTGDWGASINLDGSGSTDPDNNIATYEWDLNNDGQYDDASGITATTSFNQIGDHIIGLRVTDDGGLSDTDTATVTVLPLTLKGFYQPVDMNGIYNIVKNGRTVPLKFEVFAGSTELTDTLYIKSLTYAQTSCDMNATTDDIETTASGGTTLRYDMTDGKFIYNWKTPNTAGMCYRVTMTTIDGSILVAYFKFK